jgi:hypothetical protein
LQVRTALLCVTQLCTALHAQDHPSPVCLPTAGASAHPVFPTPTVHLDTQHTTGLTYPGVGTHAVFGDFNGDGFPDIAATLVLGDALQSFISVCMNQGGGVFAEPAFYEAGRGCSAIDTADLNRDGALDLTTANSQGDSVSVLFGRGDGSFAHATNYAVGAFPRSVKAADVDGDGWPDLVALNCNTNDVSIMINQRDGSFAPGQRVFVSNVTQPLPDEPSLGPFLAVEDFNGDGAPDIAVPGTLGPMGRIAIFLNDRHGRFTALPSPPIVFSTDPYCVITADLNGDGVTDLAAVGDGSLELSVLIGRGDGTFQPAAAYNASPANSSTAMSVSAGDLDGDGYPDLAVGHVRDYGAIPILRNRGDGTFGPRELVASDRSSRFVGLADIRRSGRCDLAVLAPDYGRTPLKVLLNDGSGKLLTYVQSDTRQGIPVEGYWAAAAADIDGDGNLDLAITVTNRNYQVVICRGLGDGEFRYVSSLSFGPLGQSAGVGALLKDLDGDGRPDLVIADSAISNGGLPGTVWIVPNAGGFQWSQPIAYPLDTAQAFDLATADFNGDGTADLAFWSTDLYPAVPGSPVQRRIQVMLNRGDGTFTPPVAYPLGPYAWGDKGSLAVADLDQDGRPDLIGVAGAWPGPGAVVTFRNRGAGRFEHWQDAAVAASPQKVMAGDFDGDGFPDLAVMHAPGPSVIPMHPYLTVLYNDRRGGLSQPSEYADAAVLCGYTALTADFNRDGFPDIALDDESTRSVLVLFNHGDGAFERPVGYGVMSTALWTAALAAGDFDHSGRTGLLAVQDVNAVSFLPNLFCARCYANCDGSAVRPTLNAADFQCFLARFAARDPRVNCDLSLTAWGAPTLNVADFICYMSKFAAGCGP